MKRLLISTLLLITCVVFGLDPSSAKKKPEKPVLERFEATISAPNLGPKTLSVDIEEFSTDDETQDLAQTFTKKGEDELVSALGRVKKGHYQLLNMETMPIRVIVSTSAGGGRRLDIVGEAPDRPFSLWEGWSLHKGFPWTFIQLWVDGHGNGKGSIIPYAKVVFNQQGQMVVKPQAVVGTPPQLVNVHSVK